MINAAGEAASKKLIGNGRNPNGTERRDLLCTTYRTHARGRTWGANFDRSKFSPRRFRLEEISQPLPPKTGTSDIKKPLSLSLFLLFPSRRKEPLSLSFPLSLSLFAGIATNHSLSAHLSPAPRRRLKNPQSVRPSVCHSRPLSLLSSLSRPVCRGRSRHNEL